MPLYPAKHFGSLWARVVIVKKGEGGRSTHDGEVNDFCGLTVANGETTKSITVFVKNVRP